MRSFVIEFILTVCLSACFISCKKDKLLTDASATVNFSQDSILFDTVFTTIGSATRNFRIINNHKQKIKLSSIRLELGSSSPFFLNVDGTPGREVNDVEILANDSIYVFVQVNVNPTSALSPLIIQDKIIVEVNGNQQSVALEAWGQDAHYHYPNQAIQYKNGYLPYSTLSSNTNTTMVWGGGALGQPDDDKPHVIYGWLVVDSAQKLIINPGVKVYFHQNAGLWVYRYGTLHVNGTYGNEVIFQGDRREADYLDMPGQWDRIWINEGSTDNKINYAIIKNSFIGIQASILLNPNQPSRLKLTNTIIRNCSKWGLYTQAYNLWAANNVVANCKEYCAAITLGGNCTLLHNTFANYYTQEGGRADQASFYLGNYDGTDAWPDSFYIANTIIDGSRGNEFETDIHYYSGYHTVKINNNYINGSIPTTTLITASANVTSGNINFDSPSNYSFKLTTGSAAIGIGDVNIPTVSGYPICIPDIQGVTRTVTISAGAYHFQ